MISVNCSWQHHKCRETTIYGRGKETLKELGPDGMFGTYVLFFDEDRKALDLLKIARGTKDKLLRTFDLSSCTNHTYANPEFDFHFDVRSLTRSQVTLEYHVL